MTSGLRVTQNQILNCPSFFVNPPWQNSLPVENLTRTRRMNADEVERILECYGFKLISQKGSHRKWRNLDRQLQVIVPYHKGRDLPIGTLRNIMTGAGIPLTDRKDATVRQNRCMGDRWRSLRKYTCGSFTSSDRARQFATGAIAFGVRDSSTGGARIVPLPAPYARVCRWEVRAR